MSELPAGWTWSTLGDVLRGELFSDGDWVESKDQDPAGDVRLIQLADVGVGEFRDRSNRFLTSDAAARLGCTYLAPGDVLVARMPDPLGRACLMPEQAKTCVTVVDVCILRPADQLVTARWLMWALNSPEVRAQVEALQSGTTRKRISRKNLATVGLAVPPRPEQDRIVAAIEEHLSRIDGAVENLRSAERRSALLTRAHVRDLFTGTNWDWTTLGEIADLKGGVTKDSGRQSDPEFVEVPYLRVANVQRGRLDLAEVARIRVPPAKAETLRLEDGDVLFNEGGDRDKLGRGWVWEGQVPGCIHQNHVFRARLNAAEFDPYFVSTHGNTWGQAWFDEHGRQTTNLASISLTTLKQLPVPAPSIGEQRRIVDELARQSDSLDALGTQLSVARRRAESLRRAILAAAFSGRLVPQQELVA